jgi:hypothetical protein
MIRRA